MRHTTPRAVRRVLAWLPHGTSLPDDDWRTRHRLIVSILIAHVPGVVIFAVVRGYGLGHGLVEALPIGLPALVALSTRPSRTFRAVAATFGLVSASAVLVHLSGGSIEMHFHFFVAVMIIAMYESWVTFGLAVAYVVVHHGVLGTLDPGGVFNHAGAVRNPWLWGGVHGLFILMESIAAIVFWRFNEMARDRLSAGEARHREIVETEARRLDLARSAFIADAAHELRTPLTVLTGMVALLTEDRGRLTPDELAQIMDALNRQSDRTVRLVNSLLDISRLDANSPARAASVDLGVPIRRAVAAAPPDPGRTLDVHIAEGLRGVADPEALERTVVNLLTNAYKYGGDHIRIDAGPVGDQVEISIQDDGPGVPPELVPTLFEPFTRGEHRSEVVGSGLGMAIVKRLVEAFGGRIRHEWIAPHGARFVVELLAGDPADPADRAAQRAESAASRISPLAGSSVHVPSTRPSPVATTIVGTDRIP